MKKQKIIPKNYLPIKDWQEAPKEFEELHVQTGELVLARKSKSRFLLVMDDGVLKWHPFIEGGFLEKSSNGIIEQIQYPFGYKVWELSQYPPISNWGTAPEEFQWLLKSLKHGEYTIQEAHDSTLHIVAKKGGKLVEHLKLPFAEMFDGWKLIRKEKYPSFENWREFYEQSIPLNKGEFTVIVNPRTWTGTYVLAKLDKTVLCHPYLDGAVLKGLKFTPYGVTEARKK